MSSGDELTAAVTGGLLPESICVRVRGLDLHCLVWGSAAAPPLVLIHGAGVHAHWWDPVVAALAGGWRVVVPDLRGHGESAWADPPSYVIEDFGGDVLELLDVLAPGPAAVCGHSLGGRVAVWIAAHHPQRVRGLAVLDTRISGLSAERIDRWRGKSVRPGSRPGHPTRRGALDSFRLTPGEPGIAPAILADLAHHAVVERTPGNWFLRFDRAVLALEGSRLADFTDLLGRIRCPALVMRGESSTVTGARGAKEIASHIDDSEVRTFPGAHHFLLAHPQPVGAALRTFFDRLR